jgi:CBS domain-containing protein
MLEKDVRHLPVLDAGEVIGMVSTRDLLLLEAWPAA